jgi:hypothetical protein
LKSKSVESGDHFVSITTENHTNRVSGQLVP